MNDNLNKLIKKQEDILVLMQKIGIQKTELSIENGQWVIKHYLEKKE